MYNSKYKGGVGGDSRHIQGLVYNSKYKGGVGGGGSLRWWIDGKQMKTKYNFNQNAKICQEY